MTSFRPVRPEDGWRARVTEDDIRTARTAWWRARERGDAPARTAELWDDLVRLFRAEAEQVAHEPRLPTSDHTGGGRADVPQQRTASPPG